MSAQQNRNKSIAKQAVSKSRRNQLLKVLEANEEIQQVIEKKKIREGEFVDSVPELMKKRR
jgi:hypothetical protein